MSIGGQFKRIGETGAAFGLWAMVIWLASSPKRLLITLAVVFFLIFAFVQAFDDTGETFYVNVNSLELLDKPFGTPAMTLQMNDTLVLIKEMADDWMKVAVGTDTLFFCENYHQDKYLGYTYKIDKTPFTKWKALDGQKVVVNHPAGYIETGGVMLKNGDVLEVVRYTEFNNEIRCKKDYSDVTLSVNDVKVDWEPILKRYPRLLEQL